MTPKAWVLAPWGGGGGVILLSLESCTLHYYYLRVFHQNQWFHIPCCNILVIVFFLTAKWCPLLWMSNYNSLSQRKQFSYLWIYEGSLCLLSAFTEIPSWSTRSQQSFPELRSSSIWGQHAGFVFLKQL